MSAASVGNRSALIPWKDRDQSTFSEVLPPPFSTSRPSGVSARPVLKRLSVVGVVGVEVCSAAEEGVDGDAATLRAVDGGGVRGELAEKVEDDEDAGRNHGLTSRWPAENDEREERLFCKVGRWLDVTGALTDPVASILCRVLCECHRPNTNRNRTPELELHIFPGGVFGRCNSRELIIALVLRVDVIRLRMASQDEWYVVGENTIT
jgi:hypothetical protein